MADEDRSADVDEKGENEDHDNQYIGENHQDMTDQADDGHDDDESVSANFGSEVDEDVSDPTDEQESIHEQGQDAKDHTESGRSKNSPDGGNAGAEPTATERSMLEKTVLPEGLRKRVEQDDTLPEAEKNQLEERIEERRTGLYRLVPRTSESQKIDAKL
ncbi:uncharacterized protein PHALS_06565 [Plasmopara halstedii]|uniref:Uncharacterized protein n=1 Tax=Plasmopara halstedii TaxID=4781 RepID=A0A0P1B3U4_PLAHL|nr:uncharacterized protein PHALS_06565 [Plasmopara halstedii]CEG48760.1 hypothetical protein PHALS_06565 [Plasmopara halstedii]|eukprot:XP_024585129.1 hypothetical protein PHALS_06565 [Plasmopara halstedii]